MYAKHSDRYEFKNGEPDRTFGWRGEVRVLGRRTYLEGNLEDLIHG